MGKIGFKDGPKTNYFFYIMISCTIIIAFFNNFFSLISSQPRGKQNCACDFLLFKYFWLFLSISDCFHAKYSFKTRWFIAIKNEDKSLLGKTRTQFRTAVCLNVFAKFKVDRFSRFLYWSLSSVHHTETFSPQDPLTMKTAILNSV